MIFQYIKSHLLISFVLLLVVISAIMLPVYFLVINKSSSQEDQAQTQAQALREAQIQEQIQAIYLEERQANEQIKALIPANNQIETTQTPQITHGPYVMPSLPSTDQLVFIYSITTNHVEGPKQWLVMNDNLGKKYDDAIVNQYTKIQNKWSYDNTNIYTIERTILNTYLGYTQDELSALGKTSKPNTYLVNQVIAIYDKNNPILSTNYPAIITPMILSTYENYKKLYPNN